MTDSIYVTKERCRGSVWILAVLLTLLPFDSYFGEIISLPLIVGLLALYMMVRLFELLRRGKFKLHSTPILLYIVYGLLLSIVTLMKAGPVYNILLFYSGIPFFLLGVLDNYTKREYMVIIKTAPFSALLFIVLNLRHLIITGNSLYLSIKEICDPNYLMTGLVLVTAMLMFLFFQEKKLHIKIIYIFLIMSILLLGIMLGTRGGLLACGFTCLTAICMGAKRPLKTLFVLGISAILVFLIALPILPSEMLKRFSLENMLAGGGSGRTTIWSNYWEIYINGNIFNIIFGFGRDIPPFMYLGRYGLAYYSHNLYLKTLLEGGLVGIVILISLFVWAIKKLLKSGNGMILSALFGFLVGSLFLDMDNMRVFWLLMIFISIDIKDNVFIMRRGKYGLFDRGTDIQCGKISEGVYRKCYLSKKSKLRTYFGE